MLTDTPTHASVSPAAQAAANAVAGIKPDLRALAHTPQNPSRGAERKVRHAQPAPDNCPYCHAKVEITTNDAVYGVKRGRWAWIFVCRPCNAYVGMHAYTGIPLGTLADNDTRRARMLCKRPFDALHYSGKLSRSDAYRRLARRMRIPRRECHFAWFDSDQCMQAEKAAIAIGRDIGLSDIDKAYGRAFFDPKIESGR